MKKDSKIIIFREKSGNISLEVNLRGETVWLNLNQMSQLFGRDKSVVSRHLSNIFKTNELNKNSVVANFATTAADGKVYDVRYYNLDAIISVGYRINSKIGTQFRIWATNVIKRHLLDGYTINVREVEKNERKLKALEKAIKVITTVTSKKQLSTYQATSILELLGDYNYALDILDGYDKKSLKIQNTTKGVVFKVGYADSKKIIENMRIRFRASDLFGVEKDSSLKSSLNAIYQSFDGRDLYPSIEEKAANLLYLVVKNHSFIDGNKRIAAALFLWFLDRNGILYKSDGMKRIGNNALVALTLLIAESDPSEYKDIMALIVNLINKSN